MHGRYPFLKFDRGENSIVSSRVPAAGVPVTENPDPAEDSPLDRDRAPATGRLAPEGPPSIQIAVVGVTMR